MSNIIKHKERLLFGFMGLVIISCSLLVISILMRISSIKATCEPVSEISRNNAKMAERQVVKKPQQQIVEESTPIVAEKTPSEPKLPEKSNIESIEKREPVLVAGRETEVTEQTKSENTFAESETWTTEQTQNKSAMESTSVADAEPVVEPEMIEEPVAEAVEEIEAQATEETQYDPAVESTTVADASPTPEPEKIVESDPEALAETEPEEILETSEPEVVEELQQQIIEDSTTVVAEETPSEPELPEESNIESIESTEPVLVAARETEVTEQEQTESEENPEETEPWISEDAWYDSIMESTFIADADTMLESETIEEPNTEVTEETETRAIEETDTDVMIDREPEEILVAYGQEAAEEPEQQTIEETTTIAAEETPSEPELFEQPGIESVESSESLPAVAQETEVIEQTEPEESLEQTEPWMAEETRYESTVESTFEVVAGLEPELETIEEPEPEVIEQTEAQAIEETDIEPFAETESEGTLVSYELEGAEEPRQEIVEEQETVFSPLLREVLGERNTANVEGLPAESIEASEPKVEGSHSEVPVSEEETGSVSQRLTNILSGKEGLAVVSDKPQTTTTEQAKPGQKASAPQAVEKPRQQTVEKKKSIFSFIQEIFKSSNDNTK